MIRLKICPTVREITFKAAILVKVKAESLKFECAYVTLVMDLCLSSNIIWCL